MLSKQDNALITSVGPTTAMGQVWRRFWIPALLATELPGPDCPPVRLRLLSENLVAFRDSAGQVGVLVEHCPHRGASLFFGRNEEGGLRCVYHGWKFSTAGACLDMPNEPAESDFRSRITATAYPAREAGSVIWIYMGPAERMPAEPPRLEWVTLPAGYQHVSKWFHDSNWLQAAEGEIDTSHISFLHSWMDASRNPNTRGATNQRVEALRDGTPRLTLEETEYGFRYGARRTTDSGDYYWRVTQWLLPSYSLIPAGGRTAGGRCWIPIDDEHTWAFGYTYRLDRPFEPREIERIESGSFFPPRMIPGTFQPLANRTNDWLLDRELQRTGNYSGIWGINEQDRALQEDQAMSPLLDRAIEHLGTGDIAVIAARRILLRLAHNMERGVEPTAPGLPDAYAVRQLDIVSAEGVFQNLMQAHAAAMLVRG